MSTCRECYTGHRHPGTPKGIESPDIHGFPTYIANPPKGTKPKGIIYFLTDGFGWRFNNNRLLADEYAERGFRVYIPDIMIGWSCPDWALEYNPLLMKTDGGITNWLLKPYYLACLMYCIIPLAIVNGIGRSRPRVDAFLTSLTDHPSAEDKGLPIFASGFCWGGKHAVLLTHNNPQTNDPPKIRAAFAAHPTAVSVPFDISNAKVPLSIAAGSDDFLYKAPARDKTKAVFEEKAKKEDYEGEMVVYQGGMHGFACRSEPYPYPEMEDHAQMAKRQALDWFERYL